MPGDNPTLARPYMPVDLEPELAACNIDRTILVQAAPTIAETEYLLGIADSTNNVAGVVGWVDLENPADRKELERLASHPRFLGIRPMIQDIPDDDWMLRADVQWGFAALTELGLTFDALGFPRHLGNFLTILQRYPDLPTVIDHCMKPQIRNPDGFDSWSAGMRRIANETNACCKLSGLVTEANENWRLEDIEPYAELVLEAFGPERIMWGSDWPVCRLRAEYTEWFEVAGHLTRNLPPNDRSGIFGKTAVRFYGLT